MSAKDVTGGNPLFSGKPETGKKQAGSPSVKNAGKTRKPRTKNTEKTPKESTDKLIQTMPPWPGPEEAAPKILRSYKLPADLVDALDRWAFENKRDKSSVVAQAVGEYLNRNK